MPSMLLDVVRLRDSEIANLPSGDAFRAAVLLWCAAWHQVPAASLPATDGALARFAGYGRDTRGWRKVRADALHGFVECSDGRLYHPVVAEKAIECSARRAMYATKMKKARDAKETKRIDSAYDTAPKNPYTSTMQRSIIEATTRPMADAGTGSLGAFKGSKVKGREEKETKNQNLLARSESSAAPERGPAASPQVEASQRTTEDKVWGDLRVAMVRAFERDGRALLSTEEVEVWRNLGYNPMLCQAHVEAGLSHTPKTKTIDLRYFANSLQERHTQKSGVVQAKAAPAPTKPEPTREDWERRLAFYERTQGSVWPHGYGAPPNRFGTEVPGDLLVERGYRDAHGQMPPQDRNTTNSWGQLYAIATKGCEPVKLSFTPTPKPTPKPIRKPNGSIIAPTPADTPSDPVAAHG